MEEVYLVKPVGVRYICDSCEIGELLPTGKNEWSANPPLFEHECNQCGYEKKFTEKYPLIRYTSTIE